MGQVVQILEGLLQVDIPPMPKILEAISGGTLSDELQVIEEQILQEQLKPPSQQDFSIQNQIGQQHQQLLIKDEQFHLQRAKKD